MLKPAYRCDQWQQETRFCFLLRNVGNTVTFILAVPPPQMVGKVRIEWFQGFTYLNATKWEGVRINPKDPPWNMVIGSGGRELRISPITESDININYFTAVAHFQHGKPIRKTHFAIQAMPTDIGLVYPGDTVTIHMPSYVSLPAESMTYKWELEESRNLLPSNMRPSRSGASLTISELRKEQEGILSCGAFTNRGVFVTQKRFLIRNVERENSELIFTATRPPHKFIPIEQYQAKMAPMLDTLSVAYGKRETSMLPKTKNQLEPQLLKEILSKMTKLKKILPENYNLTIKRKKRTPQLPESPEALIEEMDNQQAVANTVTDFYLQNEDLKHPLIAQNLNKSQDDSKTPTADEIREYFKTFEKPESEHIAPNQGGYFGDFDYDEDVRFEQEALNEVTPPPKPQPTRPLSFLEQHRQAIMERLYSFKPEKEQTKKTSIKRLRTTTEIPDEDESTLPPLQERDIIASLISECHKDSQCSLNAECVKRRKSKPGFCRCRSKFEGNGIFCWENDKSKK